MSDAEPTPCRRLLILAICCMSLLIVSLDTTALNVALPDIRTDLGTSVSGLQWVVDAYTLVLAALLMLAGSTADRMGRRRVFRWGLALFVLGSLLCSLAPGLGWLVAARALQAVGGSMLNPVAMSIITNTFTDPRERARAIGVWGGVVGISMAAGPILGGLLVEVSGWQAIFWVNVPVGLAALLLTTRYVPESRAPRSRRVDPVGQILMIVLLGSLTYGIIESPHHGPASPLVAGCAAAALLSLAGLVVHESRRPEPLIDPRFFRSVPFAGATATAVCAFAALGGFLFLTSLYLQEIRGMSALHAGLCTLPMAAMTLVFAPLSGRLVGSRGPRLPLVAAGLGLTASGLLLAWTASADLSLGVLFCGYVLFGIGFGLVNAPITNTAVSGMPRAQAGVAAAVASTSRQVGSSLGVAVIGAVMASATAGGVGAGGGLGGAAGFQDAQRTAWWIITGCGLAVLLLGVLTTGRRARESARRAALLLGGEAPGAPAARPTNRTNSEATTG
ncbi:MFS transporter [Streptomyces albus subsp. chlorinus]|uniref:MFS transporter n=1 Tax=Streptomyces albus TaxID=1888 RepID=UPI00156DB229|nr:MFS transporter [Streptomyces albus]NSC22095.1 MFS transporter [Streptomyces albus subsp. chlorinus]